jgi:hypothetical protein
MAYRIGIGVDRYRSLSIKWFFLDNAAFGRQEILRILENGRDLYTICQPAKDVLQLGFP